MKQRSAPVETASGNNYDQACEEGLNAAGIKYVRHQIKKFKNFGVAVPYGIIRRSAIGNPKFTNKKTK